MTTALASRLETLANRINQLFVALCENYAKSNAGSKYYHPDQLSFEIVSGTKYHKIVMHHQGSRSVHAFVHKQSGAVYKPASWKSPAKHVRYNLLDDASFEDCLKRADWAGGYLYLP